MKFIAIPPSFLRSISSGCDRIPALYYEGNPLLRYYFWLRLRTIFRQVLESGVRRRRCLDFGGGGGVFLPTLSASFDEVSLIDLITDEAKLVKERFALANVTLLQQDVRSAELPLFDAVIAADVLEHFASLDEPLDVLHRVTSPDGVLVTSLPTENWIYVLLRKIFGIEKPDDHFHTGYEVERRLEQRGFRRVRASHIPNRLTPLFLVTSWRRTG